MEDYPAEDERGDRVVVDTNVAETPLYDALCAALGAEYVRRKRLDIGDVTMYVSTDVGSRELLFERKTWADLAASIQDGRYSEQKARFLESDPPDPSVDSQLVYLLESPCVMGFAGATRGMSNKAIRAAELMTQFRDDIHVVYARDNAGSAEVLVYLFQKLREGALAAGSRKRSKMVGTSSAKRRKSDNLASPTALTRAMLGMIPKMSDKKAAAVVAVYPTLGAMASCTARELADIKCDGRRLGPTLAQQICDVVSTNKSTTA